MILYNNDCDVINIGFKLLVESDAQSTADAMFSVVDSLCEARISMLNHSLKLIDFD